MGREWYWSRPVSPRPERDATAGCMSGVLNFLDFHQLLFAAGDACTRPPPSSPPRRPSPQHIKPPPSSVASGIEAPRNSLELEDAPPASASTSAASEDYYFDIPLGIQVPTAVDGKSKRTVSSLFDEERRVSHSQSLAATPRTPNVVARLMGLEILPDVVCSPPVRTRRPPSRSVPPTPVVAEQPERYRRSKKSNGEECKREAPPPVRAPLQPRNTNVINLRVETGSRSLPETPRPSSSRPWEADPRLSLQVNKENIHRAMHEFGYLCQVSADQYCSPQTTKLRRRENMRPLQENKSPRNHYSPREIVKQVKDSINNKRASGGGGPYDDENGSRSRRNRQTEKKVLSGAILPSPCSAPRTRFVEPPSSRSPPPPKSLRTSPKRKEDVELKRINMTPSQCKSASFERYTEKIKKKHPSPETKPDTKKQSPIASSSVRSSRQPPPLATAMHRERINDFMKASTRIRLPKEGDPEFRYVRSILEHAGILTPAAHAVRWYSLSLPVDPIIFHQLELELPLLDQEAEGDLWVAGLGPLRHRWNRKLLFHLVEEVIGDLLSGAAGRRSAGACESLLLRLWGRIRSFPAVDCKVVGDIDALVEGDFREAKIRGLLGHPSVVAEAESITEELVKGILDSLVEEAAASLSLGGAGGWKSVHVGTSCRYSDVGVLTT